MKKSFLVFSRIEITFLFLLSIILFIGIGGLAKAFQESHTYKKPTFGGVYTEGVVGSPDLLILNPVFIHSRRENSVDADISRLIFSGLMRFNPETGEIEDYMADHTLSLDKTTYTFKLKEGVRWHDGHEVTANDILFTFQDVIQNQNFQNIPLKNAFTDVEINKIDERTVTFKIPNPYKFFLTNFTVGLLPRHILESVNVQSLERYDFSSNPIGAGPYRYKEIKEVRTGVSKLVLEAFRQSSISSPYIDTIEFQFYPNKDSLLIALHEVDGISPFQTAYIENFLGKFFDGFFIDARFKQQSFTLPQYAAIFINMDRDVFKREEGKQVRIALQVATDRENIISMIPSKRVDTPLLETNTDDWIFNYSPLRAQGALKDGGWYIPEKMPLTFALPGSQNQWIEKPTKEAQLRQDDKNKKIVFSGVFPENSEKFTLSLKKRSPETINNEMNIISSGEIKRNQKNWETELIIGESVPYGTSDIEVRFFDKKETEIGKDALSLYIKAQDEENENNEPDIKTDSENITTEEVDKYQGVTRVNKDYQPLSLTLITQNKPFYYSQIAKKLQEDWGKVGIEVKIEIYDNQEFLEQVAKREYDLLLFGQNLGYNLDTYEFFHESQVKGSNLSEYKSPSASMLIEEIRSSHDHTLRTEKLNELRDILKSDIPAIFLFSPEYLLLIDKKVKTNQMNSLSLLRDRFSLADSWYIRTENEFEEGINWKNFPKWAQDEFSQLFNDL